MNRNIGSSLQARLRARLESNPEGRALTFFREKEELSWRPFHEFYAASARRSAALAEHGLGRRDICVLVLRSHEFATEAIVGCLLLGAVPVLVSPPVVGGLHSILRQVIEHVVRKTRAHIVLMDREESALGKELESAHRKLRVLVGPDSCAGGDIEAAPFAYPAADEIAALQLTSGTTGFPRVCVWKQQCMLASLDGMEKAMALTDDDVCVNWTPLYHDMGLVNNFLLCLVKGAPLAMMDTFDFVRRPSIWLRALHSSGGTVTWSPNFGYAIATQRIQDGDLNGVRLDRVRAFWNAAERIHLDTVLGFQRRFEPYGVSPDSMKTNFGCAENVGGATFSDSKRRFRVDYVHRQTLYEKGMAVPATETSNDALPVVGVGRPYPGMSIQIRSRTGQRLADGQVGEITLDTPSRMTGYLRDARATRRALKDGVLRTGDYGYKRGEELFWTGRVRERINLHGSKFDPSDFENTLLQIEGLRQGCFAAFGIDDAKSGTQRLVIMVEVRDSCAGPFDTLLQEIRRRVAVELGVTAGDIVLLKQGTMSKTSSGKRRHSFYKRVYMQGAFQPISAVGNVGLRGR